MGLKTTYASGKRDNNKVSINNNIFLKFLRRIKFNIINSTIKVLKFLIYINV